MKTMKRLMATSCLVAAATAAMPVWAQTTQDAPAVTGDPVADAKIASDGENGDSRATRADDIVITGTRIVRPNNKSAAPIVTTTRAEIEAQGATTIEEVLNRLPQVQVNSEQNFAESEGRQRIKLRSLGYERTLMLIDGMRFGLANTIDVGIIPNSLVERVDVLSGGASSVYGADAVSGVINFVMKKNFEGVRLDGSYSFFNHDNRDNAVTEAARRANFNVPLGMTNDGGRAAITLSAGTNLFNDRVNITTYIDYRQSNPLRLGDRSHASCEVTQPTPTSRLSCTLASFTAAGTILPQSGPRAGRLLVNDPLGSRTFVGINTGPGTSANPYDDIPFQRAFERVNTGGFLTARITKDIELYGSALFYRDKSYNTLLNRTLNFGAYGEGPYQVNCDNPFLSASQAGDLCGTGTLAGRSASIDVRYRFDSNPPVRQRFTNEAYRLVAGLRGRGLDDVWSYDLAAMLSRAKLDTIDVNFPEYDNVNRSLDVVNVNGTPTCRSVVNGSDPGCVPFNAFVPFNSDPALSNYLFGGASGATSVRIPRLVQYLGTVSGDLGRYGITSPFATQGAAIALGVEYREETERRTANDVFRELNGGDDQRFTQNILESNVELQLPLVENQRWTQLLQVNGGYRVSKYNRLQGKFDTWKVEGLWAPVDDITFRGSYNKSQAAPGVVSAQSAADVSFNQGFYSDPCATRVNPANPNGARLAPVGTVAQCRNTGLPDNLYGSATLICPDERCTVREGGFNLTPESAYTTTFGVVLRPRFLPGLTISADRFIINLRDQIEFLQPQNLINDCLLTGDDYFCRAIVRNPGSFTLSSSPASDPAAGWVARGSANGFRSQSHGYDFQSQYNLGLGSVGRLDMSFNGTLMTKVGGQASPTVAARNCVGYFGRSCGESMPKWAHQFRTTWSSVDRVVSVSVNWRHRGAMPLDVYAPADTGVPQVAAGELRPDFPRIRAFNWFDLSLAFDVTKQMTFRLAANNIFDRDPPIVPDSRSRIGLLRSNSIMGYDLLGRQLVASISLRM